ncbi:hypothetical protein DV736_g3694, partial [Chaetothyriales sp. CBS 134916]
MHLLSVSSPLRPASASFFKLCARYFSSTPGHHEATYRRSRVKLKIKPDPAFLPTKAEQHDHIIYNPPPSMPNVYHTPTIFLPKDDKRRGLRATALPTWAPQTSAVLPPLPPGVLPPPVRKPYEKKYHLTKAQIEEIRRLAEEDPAKWTRTTLSKKFECSPFFITMIFDGMDKKKNRLQKEVTAAVKSHWGVKRRTAREDRQIRKERWFRDA